jgi:hypothetical protein
MKYLILVSIIFGAFTQLFAQDSAAAVKRKKMHGTFYATWGYNSDYYTKSKIHVKESTNYNYDFTIFKAKAHDQPDTEDLLNTPLTVPQYVFYAGYFFNNKGDWGIEGGWDHLKYVVTPNQTAHMQGTIDGVYYDKDTVLTDNFFHYEHTNGNNYLTVSALKRFTFYESKNTHHKLSFIAKAGGGILIPKTYSVMTAAANTNDGPFRVAGYVLTTAGAIRYDIYRYFFIEASAKVAYARYTYDVIGLSREGVAKHAFGSLQLIGSFGINIPLSKQ